MAIYNGSTKIKALYRGAAKLKSAYVGGTKVWGAEQTLYDSGDKCADVTGGWNQKKEAGQGACTDGGTYLAAATSGAKPNMIGWCTASAVNYAALGIRTLYAEVEVTARSGGTTGLRLCATGSAYSNPQQYIPVTAVGTYTLSVDVSATAAGIVYLCSYTAWDDGQIAFRIKRVWGPAAN